MDWKWLAVAVALAGCGDKGGKDSSPAATGSGTGTGTGAATGTGTGAGTGTGTGTVTGGGTGATNLGGIWVLAEIETAAGVSVDDTDHLGVLTISEAAGTIDTAFFPLVSRVPSAELSLATDSYVVAAGNRVVVTHDNGTQVFQVTGQADERTLTWDQADPQNAVIDPSAASTRVELVRQDVARLTGSWNGVSVRNGPYLTPLDTCLPLGTNLYQTMSFQLSMDDSGVMVLSGGNSLYSDAYCTVPSGTPQVNAASGLWRDAVPNADMWIYVDTLPGGNWVRMNVDLQGDDLVLTQIDCLPSPMCTYMGFGELELVRAP